MKNFKNQNYEKGITLIALIVTIIVMIILVLVTINLVIGDEGIIKNAKKSSEDTERETILEKIMAMAIISDEAKIDTNETISNVGKEYPNYEYDNETGKLSIQGKLGTYYYKVTSKEISLWNEETSDSSTPQPPTIETEKLKKYILGSEEKGRNFLEIFDGETGAFIGKDSLPNSQEEVEIMEYKNTIDEACLVYNNSVYKIKIDPNTFYTKDCELLYKQSGREGQDLGDILGENYNGWIILYDYVTSVEAISPTEKGSLALGDNYIPDNGWQGETMEEADIDNDNQLTNIEKSIYCYNNSIDIINKYCENLSDLPANNGVRSLGMKKDLNNEMYNKIPSNFQASAYNGKLKTGDNIFDNDLIRLFYYNHVKKINLITEKNYWIALRDTYLSDTTLRFSILGIGKKGFNFNTIVGGLSEFKSESLSTNAVRPIIKVNVSQ